MTFQGLGYMGQYNLMAQKINEIEFAPTATCIMLRACVLCITQKVCIRVMHEATGLMYIMHLRFMHKARCICQHAHGMQVLQDLPWGVLNVGVAPPVERGQHCAVAHQ